MQITLTEAIQLVKDGSTPAEVEATFSVGNGAVGAAQVVAVEAAPVEVQANAELTAAVELLWEAGTARAQTKGATPRLKRTLGDTDGIEPYRVIITQAKS